MGRQSCQFHVHQIRFYKLNDAIPNIGREQVDDGVVTRRRRGEGPTLNPIRLDYLSNLIGQLPVDSALGFSLQFGLRDRRLVHSGPVVGGETPGEIGHLISEFPMRIGNVERLNQL